ncbi:MAG: hypothetical protein ACJASY_004309 [Halioglobus sp.]|jgi:hypothetical protein
MNRRDLLLGIIAGGAVVGAGGVVWLGSGSNNNVLTIGACLQTLDKMMSVKATTTGHWNLYEILVHAAQSVEFSMSSFPEHKPAFFKSTIGKLAFAAFSAKGEMTHALSEAIPGAASIKEDGDTTYAYERFKESMLKFKGYDGRLAEHFAYGSLTKQQYERAHAMHFYNHLLEIELTSYSLG